MNVKWGIRQKAIWYKRVGIDRNAQPVFVTIGREILVRYTEKAAKVSNANGVEIISAAHCTILESRVAIGDKIVYQGDEHIVISRRDALGLYGITPSCWRVYF